MGRTVLARKALRIHAMIASRAGSGLSLPTTGCGILHKEPLLSGSQFPQLSYRKPGPVPPPRCGHTGGQAGTESPLQTVKCRGGTASGGDARGGEAPASLWLPIGAHPGPAPHPPPGPLSLPPSPLPALAERWLPACCALLTAL